MYVFHCHAFDNGTTCDAKCKGEVGGWNKGNMGLSSTCKSLFKIAVWVCTFMCCLIYPAFQCHLTELHRKDDNADMCVCIYVLFPSILFPHHISHITGGGSLSYKAIPWLISRPNLIHLLCLFQTEFAELYEMFLLPPSGWCWKGSYFILQRLLSFLSRKKRKKKINGVLLILWLAGLVHFSL